MSSPLPVPLPEAVRLDDNALSNIKYFRKQWRLYTFALGIHGDSEAKKFEVLRRIIGSETVAYMDTFLDKATLDAPNCDQILSTLEERFSPQERSIVQERLIFHALVQAEGESIDSFRERVDVQAWKCGFTESVFDFIRDRFIAGLSNQALASALVCTEHIYSSFPDMVEYCREAERKEAELQKQTPITMNVSVPDLATSTLVNGTLATPSTSGVSVKLPNGLPKVEMMDVAVESVPIVKIKEEKKEFTDDQSPVTSEPPPPPIRTSPLVSMPRPMPPTAPLLSKPQQAPLPLPIKEEIEDTRTDLPTSTTPVLRNRTKLT